MFTLATFSVTPNIASASPTTICEDGVCTIVDQDATSGSGSTAGAGCEWKGSRVPCDSAGKSFDSTTGCYVGTPAVPPPDGPVLAQQKAYGGSIVYATCPYGGAGGYIWQPPAKPVVTAGLVRAEAIRLIPTAAVGVAPKNVSLVNVETVLWADAPQRRTLAPVTLLGQQVSITLALDHVSWNFGDGQRDADAPAGKAYDARNDPCKSRQCEDYYGHTYRRTGKVAITATAYWQASFTVDGGAAHDAGNVPGPDATTNLIIKQARAVLVPNPGDRP